MFHWILLQSTQIWAQICFELFLTNVLFQLLLCAAREMSNFNLITTHTNGTRSFNHPVSSLQLVIRTNFRFILPLWHMILIYSVRAGRLEQEISYIPLTCLPDILCDVIFQTPPTGEFLPAVHPFSDSTRCRPGGGPSPMHLHCRDCGEDNISTNQLKYLISNPEIVGKLASVLLLVLLLLPNAKSHFHIRHSRKISVLLHQRPSLRCQLSESFRFRKRHRYCT